MNAAAAAFAVAVFTISHEPQDADAAATIAADVRDGTARIEAFFGMEFVEPVAVTVAPDRAAFSAWFPAEWGMTDTACWMVASGVADRMAVLSPRVWDEDACEHDADDATHVRNLVVHELVHVFHGQHNPTRDFTGAEEIGWFLEGLATYASGQLDEGHLAPAKEAIERGLAPTELENAWSGEYRYGVCGTLVAYLDETFGREALRDLLAVTTEADLLARIGLTEAQLLESWRESVLGG